MPIADLPIPDTGAVAALPIPERNTVTPDQADAASYQDTAGPLRKGLRSGFNQLGAMTNAFVGTLAEPLGLEEFAKSRMADAEYQARFADAVSPDVRDYRSVKDLTDLANYIQGLIGQTAATMAPAVAGAGLGRAAGGLRGAFAGAAAGSFVPNSGEQALRIRGEGDPMERLKNMLVTGGATSALDMLVPGSVVGQAGKKGAKGSIKKAIAENAATEGVTEGLQEAIGQGMHTQIAPGRDKTDDTSDIINSAVAGAVGGGALGGAGKTFSKAMDLLPDRQQSVSDVEKNLKVEDKPLDEFNDEDILGNTKLESEADILSAIEEKGQKSVEGLSKLWEKVKDNEEYKKFADFRDNAETRAEFVDAAKKRYNDLEVEPKIRKAFKSVQAFFKGVDKGVKGEKQSKQRTAMDFAIYDNMIQNHLDPEIAKNMTPQQKIDLATYVKHIAMYEFGKRDEIAGPGKPAFSNEEKGVAREQDRGTTARRMPEGMLQLFGKNAVAVLNSTNEILTKGGLASPQDFTKHVADAENLVTKRTTHFESIVRNNLRAEIAADPAAREKAAQVLAPRLLDTVLGGNQPNTVQRGQQPAHALGAPETSLKQVESERSKEFNDQMTYAFGANKDAVMEELDKMRERVTTHPDTFFESTDQTGTNDHVEAEGGLPQETDSTDESATSQPARAQDEGPAGDKRIGVPIRDLATAQSTLKALQGEYGFANVSFSVEQTEKGNYTIEAKDRVAEDSFSDQEWANIREPEEYGKSGLKNGIITVQLKDGRQNKINLVRLTSQIVRSTSRQEVGNVNYVYDVVSRGLSRLLADPNVKGLNKQTSEQVINGPKGWDLPDDTPVAFINKKLYTWGDVKSKVNISPDTLKIRRIVSNAIEQARESETTKDIEQKVIPFLDEKISEIEAVYTQAKMAATKATRYKDGVKTRSDPKLDAAAKKYSNYLERVRGAKELVLDEVDRRQREGDAPRSDIKGLVEDERIRGTTAAETPTGQRVVEGDTGIPTQTPVDRGPGGSLESGVRIEDKMPVTGSYQGTVISDEQYRKEIAANKRLDSEKSGKQTPSQAQQIEPKKDLPEPHKPKPRKKLSTQNIGRDGIITPEEADAVRAFVAKVLGDKAKVFFKKLDHAGSFMNMDGVEVLQVAIDAMNPMGVARHEAAHALVARLIKADPKTANTLLAAAGSPTVVSRLRTLLKEHPQALEQLTDPEERLAYMYQFWAAGELKVGPNTKTVFDQIKGFLRKIAGIWSETYKQIENVEKAESVFDLFEQGKIADPNSVAEVLRDSFPKTPFEHATELMGPVGKYGAKLFFTAEGIVRGMNIPEFTEILDKFYSTTGQPGKEPGMLQTRYQTLNKFYNKMFDYLDGTTEVQRRQALEALQNELEPSDPAIRNIVQGIRGLLKEAYDYMDKSGVKAVVWNKDTSKYDEKELGFIAAYFPRFYNRQAIFEDRVNFEKALVNHGLTAESAKEVAENILRNSKVDPQENDYSAGLTYYAPNSQDRKLDVPTSVVAPWLHKDLAGSMYQYLNYAVRRAEYAKRFGNQGQEIQAATLKAKATPEQLKTFNNAVMAMEGSLGFDISPEMKQILGGIVTYQNFRLLPLALFTSLVDPIGIAVRGGGMKEAFDAFTRGIRGIFSENKDASYELAKLIGTISVNNEAHMLAEAYGTQYLTDWQRKLNGVLFKYNGMESWNRQMRVAATGAAERFIIRHAAGYNEHSERYLSELGLTKDDIRMQGGGLILDDKIRQAISTWVDGAILRPNAAIRPIWMSDPHYMLFAHLKQFTYSFQKTIVARVVHEMEQGNFTPAFALLSYVPLLIASDVLRYMLTPGGGDDDTLRKLGLGGLIWRGTQRAGLFGPGQYALDAYGDLGHGKIPVASILGPSAQQLMDFGYAAAGQGDIGREFKKAIPGYMLVR